MAEQNQPIPPPVNYQADIPEDDYTEQPQDDFGSVAWTASEFIAHEKSKGWFVNLALVAFVITAFIYFVTRSIFSSVAILMGIILFGVFGARQPRQLTYQLDSTGLKIGEKWYGFQEFRSFSVIKEGAFSSIAFLPLKRFSPLISVYYAPADEEKILNILSNSLPYEDRKLDPVDSLMHRIRF